MKKLFIFILACTTLTIAANAQEMLKKCENGVYKCVKYKIGDKPIEDYPFEVYKILHTNENTQNTYLFHLDLYSVIERPVLPPPPAGVSREDYISQCKENPFQYKEIPLFILRETSSELEIMEAEKKGFVNRWVCDMAHRTIKYGEVVNEHFSKKHKASKIYKKFKKVFTEKPKKNNWFHGVWKLQTDQVVIYKIYGNKHRITVTLANGKAQGRIDTFEIMKNGSTLENGNACYFSWSTPDTYQLSYYINNNIFYEDYRRSSIEEFEQELIQILGVTPCFVR